MQVPRVVSARRWTQWIVAGVVAPVGVRFSLWAAAHLDGRWPDVARPPGVEAFLPINAMLGVRHLIQTGIVDAIHPAGLAIFIGICLMSVVLAKSFCSDAFFHCASENIQIHGGIGFTWEHDAHLYFKRAKSSQLMLGDPALHRARLAERIGL